MCCVPVWYGYVCGTVQGMIAVWKEDIIKSVYNVDSFTTYQH